jgi:hypothetical protein
MSSPFLDGQRAKAAAAKTRATTACWGASRRSGRDLPLRFYERYHCRRDKTRDQVVPLPGFLAKKGAKGLMETATDGPLQTGHEGEGSLMADVVRTVLTAPTGSPAGGACRADVDRATGNVLDRAHCGISRRRVCCCAVGAQRSRGSLTTLPAGRTTLLEQMQP